MLCIYIYIYIYIYYIHICTRIFLEHLIGDLKHTELHWLFHLLPVFNWYLFLITLYVILQQLCNFLKTVSNLATWLSVCLPTKLLWVQILLQSLKLEISHLLLARKLLTVRQYIHITRALFKLIELGKKRNGV